MKRNIKDLVKQMKDEEIAKFIEDTNKELSKY